MKEIVEYQDLMPAEFERRIGEFPLVYVPVGALEWHGEHQAIGLDGLKMHGLCCEAARRGGGIVFPPIYHAIPGMIDYSPDYSHGANMPFTEDFLRNLLDTTLHALDNVGFKAAILITGHTSLEQIALVEDVAKKYDGAMIVCGTNDAEYGGAIDHASDHAGKWETSILWHLRPDLVDITRLPRDLETKCYGIYGDDPRVHASPELGRRAVDAVADDLAALAKRLLTQ